MLLRFTLLLLINLSNSFVLQYNTFKSLNNLNNLNKRMSNANMVTPNEIIDLVNKKQLVRPDTWTYNELTNHLNTIKSAVIVDNQNLGLFYDYSDSSIHIFKYLPTTINKLIDLITQKGIDYQVYSVPIPEPLQVPFIIQVIGLYLLFNLVINRFIGPGGPGSGMNPFNSMNKKMAIIEDGQVTTTFEDVAGLDEAKEELEEIVDYLKVPLKYTFAGAKIPKGVLLEGPPGTGKTLLARAVAGEAGVAFISASGSEFIEMFVGVGAQRVRNLFEQAKQNKPCVIFIDEIDAVGGRRGYGFNSGGNDEREQTLNQILTNMDGFEKSDGIIVLAATNRADTLDPALKRSGRFDRKVQVPLPDLSGRKEIAKVHLKNKPNVTIDYDNLAILTSGFSGADLATLANEAALLGVRTNKTVIDDRLIQKAFEKMTIGLPKKYDSRSIQTKRLVSVHEIGHTMMVQHFTEYFKLQRVTMNANTAGAGGYTLFTPKEFYAEYQTKGYFLAQIIVALGGRAAEIVYFKNYKDSKFNNRTSKSNNIIAIDTFSDYSDIDITTGASADIRQANNIAKKYLELFENYIVPESISDSTQNVIDTRISELIKECLDKAVDIIETNEEHFNKLSNRLMHENTIVFD
jgi:cell division protease FtsH